MKRFKTVSTECPSGVCVRLQHTMWGWIAYKLGIPAKSGASFTENLSA